MAWSTFILWSFVFGWHRQYTGQNIFNAKIELRMWSLVTGCGLIGALFLRTFIDSVLRPMVPKDYPDSLSTWAAMTLFVLAFDQLFLCFAPFAFFVRLFQSSKVAASITVLFGALLIYLKARSWFDRFSSLFILEMFVWRIAAGSLLVYFYLRGGVLLIWWWAFLLQLRHLFELLL
jgi:hypothetical protein